MIPLASSKHPIRLIIGRTSIRRCAGLAEMLCSFACLDRVVAVWLADWRVCVPWPELSCSAICCPFLAAPGFRLSLPFYRRRLSLSSLPPPPSPLDSPPCSHPRFPLPLLACLQLHPAFVLRGVEHLPVPAAFLHSVSRSSLSVSDSICCFPCCPCLALLCLFDCCALHCHVSSRFVSFRHAAAPPSVWRRRLQQTTTTNISKHLRSVSSNASSTRTLGPGAVM